MTQSDRKSDLPVRTASAIVMLAVAGGALWAGGWWWSSFVGLVGAGVFWEWSRLTKAISASVGGYSLWLAGGAIYLVPAMATLVVMRSEPEGKVMVLYLLAGVIATDVGAYFAGRTIGGPKIARSISPSKTWAGLAGGMLAAGLVFAGIFLATLLDDSYQMIAIPIFALGALVAVIAQTGDFFESWMKRRAGVKDSSNLIPGHGGVFDRVDGLLSVCFVMGVMQFGFGLG